MSHSLSLCKMCERTCQNKVTTNLGIFIDIICDYGHCQYPIKQGLKDPDTRDFSISLGKNGKINKLIVKRGTSSSECFFLADRISYCNKENEHVSLIKFQQNVSPPLERMVLFCLTFSLGKT